MLKFMLCCQGDPNCPRFPAPECNQTLCASVVLTFASLDSHRHHLGSSTGPRSFSPSAISLLHYPHPLPSLTAIWCQDSSSAAPCTPCSRLFGCLSRYVDQSLLGLLKSCLSVIDNIICCLCTLTVTTSFPYSEQNCSRCSVRPMQAPHTSIL